MTATSVTQQYAQGDLFERILAALVETGKDPDNLTVQDLTPVDHFHTLGAGATEALAVAAGLGPGRTVLDAGCGLGGPARTLASGYGCLVTGIDLTPEYCWIAQEFNRRVGLQGSITIREADALKMPVPDAGFDVVRSMHVAMNIQDKDALYGEFARVLKPGGQLAFFDIIGGEGELQFPVPWADEPSINHLVGEDRLRQMLDGAGFEVDLWEDATRQGVEFFANLPKSALGPHLVIPGVGPKMANLKSNLESGSARVVRAVCSLR